MEGKKLELSKETVRKLTEREAQDVAGGVIRPLHTIIPFPCLTRHVTCDEDYYCAD